MASKRRGRQVEAGALAALAPLLVIVPVWLAVMALLWSVLRLFVPVAFWQVAALHAAAGVLLFWRPAQRVLLTRLLGARPAVAIERRRLDPLWADVARSCGEEPDRYVLCVADADEVNAFACGGHLVVVSSYALDALPDDELAGVLAHELGHHLGMHTVALTMSHWLAIPVVALARAGFWLKNVAQAFTDTIATRSATLTVIGRMVSGVLLAAASVLQAGVLAANALGNVFGKGSEFQADERAVTAGYGPQLSAALRRFVSDRSGEVVGDWSWRSRLLATHPAPRTRIARIDALVRRRNGASRGTLHPSDRTPLKPRQSR